MAEFVRTTAGGVPREAQLRANAVLDSIVQTRGEIFRFAAAEMRRRWDALERIFVAPGAHSLPAPEPPAFCGFFGEVRRHAPAYAWLTCDRAREREFELPAAEVARRWRNLGIPPPPGAAPPPGAERGCRAHLLYHNVSAMPGSAYGAGAESARIELLERAEDFDLLAEKLALMALRAA